MRLGFTLPQVGPLAHEAAEIARYAREVEQLGAESRAYGWLPGVAPGLWPVDPGAAIAGHPGRGGGRQSGRLRPPHLDRADGWPDGPLGRR